MYIQPVQGLSAIPLLHATFSALTCQLYSCARASRERERVCPTLGGWRGSRAVTRVYPGYVPRGPTPLLFNITSLFQPSRAAVRHLQVPSHSHSTHTRCNTARPSEMNSATPTRSACHMNCCSVAHPSNRCGHRPYKGCRAAHSKTTWCSSHIRPDPQTEQTRSCRSTRPGPLLSTFTGKSWQPVLKRSSRRNLLGEMRRDRAGARAHKGCSSAQGLMWPIMRVISGAGVCALTERIHSSATPAAVTTCRQP